MARKTVQITPEQVKALRQKVGITQKQAAASVHLSLRQWQKFEESESSSTYIRIPDATLELFCLKTGLSFPPVFGSAYRLGKTISFAGGPGGIGRSTLTRDMALLLTQEGYEVLIVTDRRGQLVLAEKRFIASNTAFPKILAVEDIDWNDRPYSNVTIENIKKNYDFIFFDLEKNQEHLNISKYGIDLIITPTNPTHHVDTSLRNIVRFMNELEENQNTLIACLLVGISHDFNFDFYYYSFDQWISDKDLELSFKKLGRDREHQEGCLKDITDLTKFGVYVFDAYSSDIYKHYEALHVEKNGFWSTGYHFIDKPNTLSAHQMRAIKNELLKIFNIHSQP
jgi:transcriptional regulator with XRE-family HTH domain